jgi:hypothetical protein
MTNVPKKKDNSPGREVLPHYRKAWASYREHKNMKGSLLERAKKNLGIEDEPAPDKFLSKAEARARALALFREGYKDFPLPNREKKEPANKRESGRKK